MRRFDSSEVWPAVMSWSAANSADSHFDAAQPDGGRAGRVDICENFDGDEAHSRRAVDMETAVASSRQLSPHPGPPRQLLTSRAAMGPAVAMIRT